MMRVMPENRPNDKPVMPSAGAIGRNVLAAVEELAAERGLSMRKLSAALEAIGRPIPPLGLARILKGERRVDVDELVALAAVLGVNPNRLLMPTHVASEAVIELTPGVQQRASIAWGWARGRWPLPPDLWPEGTALSFPTALYHEFAKRTSPDFGHPLDDPAVAELAELQQLIELVLSDPAQVLRWTRTRETILRRFRLAAIQLEELFARLDGEAELPDSGAAAEQLQVTVEQVRKAAVPFTDETEQRYREAARDGKSSLPGPDPARTFDPFRERGQGGR